jgi:putative pyruvate formate lyase activating enzyme
VSAGGEHLEWAERMSAACRLCPRNCGVNRRRGEIGWCGAGDAACFFIEFVHCGEEPELAPSHTVYLTGCNLRCQFCHTADDRASKPAEELTAARLRELVAHGRKQGARNLNFLGGDPGVNLPALLRLFAAFSKWRMPPACAHNPEDCATPPLVWNTNLYCTAETLERADEIADLYLPDLKFGNHVCAQKIAEAGDYWDVVRERLRELYGRAKDRIVLRHLVLPGHVDCCTRPALEWVAREMPAVRLSLKLDYLAMPRSRGDERLGRFLRDEEGEQALRLVESLGLRTASLAEVAPRPPTGPAAAGRDFEVVIAPSGEMYLRIPTQEAMAVAGALAPAASHYPQVRRPAYGTRRVPSD